MSKSELATLIPPPRSVPLLVRAQVLFAGISIQAAWLFLAFGGIGFWVFALNADLTSFWYFRGELETAPGVVIETKDTGFSVGTIRTPIYAYSYVFTDPGGTEYRGVSYAPRAYLERGQPIVAEYPKGNPSFSRIVGMRRAVLAPYAGLVVVFPLCGLALVLVSLRKGLRAIRLLEQGQLGQGKLKSKVATNAISSAKVVYRLTFEFLAGDGRTFQAVAETNRPAVFEDEPKKPLLYDPSNPADAIMLDAVVIDEAGNLRAASALGALRVLLLPAATVIGHGVWAYFKFFQ